MAAPQLRGVSRALGSAVLPQQGFQLFLTQPPFSHSSNPRLGAALPQSWFWRQGGKILLGEEVLQNPHTSFRALTAMAVDTNEDSVVISLI